MEAGNFEDRQVGRLHLIHVVDERVADVAANPDFGVFSAGIGLGDTPHNGGCGGFARRAGDAERAAGNHFHEHLGVVGKRQSAFGGFDHQRVIERHAAGDAEQVSAIQDFERMPAEYPFHTGIGQHADFVLHVLG